MLILQLFLNSLNRAKVVHVYNNIIIYILKVTGNLKVSNNCSRVKVQYLDPRCSGVEVRVLEKFKITITN